jgi:ATP-dependent DNA ligase
MNNAIHVGSITSSIASGTVDWHIYAGVVRHGTSAPEHALPVDPEWYDNAKELSADYLGFVLKTRQIVGSDVLTVVEPTYVPVGKNRGRKNQTNKFTQALRDAKGQLDKRLKKKSQEYIHPMLATDIELDALDQLTYPLIVQEKLDGIRVILAPNGGLQSRGGKPLPVPDHLVADLVLLSATGLTWDGELFTNSPLQDITGAARGAKPKTAKAQAVRDSLRVHIYDVVCPGDYRERLALMEQRLPAGLTACELVPSETVHDPERIRERFQQTIAAGGEGLIIRLFNGPLAGPYEDSTNGRRAKQLYKLKGEYSAEGIIHSVVPGGKGRDANAAIFVIDTLPNTFPAAFQKYPSTRIHVVPNATIKDRRQMLLDVAEYVGKLYTFTFQDVSKSGEPLRARGISVRVD